jgi:fructose-specific PTS system IIA-like component
VGLGLDSISAVASAIPALKEELARLHLGDCQRLVRDCLACSTSDEVSRCVEGFSQRTAALLIDSEMILVGVEAGSREEAIKQAIDRLYVVGRTDEPLALEEAVWEREKTYATGFGYGFAIPHCKCNAVRSNSLALLKLRQPVEWGSLDGQPVRVVLLLAVREADGATEHMRVLARLARQLMHQEFRSKIEAQDSPEALCAFLKEAVQN